MSKTRTPEDLADLVVHTGFPIGAGVGIAAAAERGALVGLLVMFAVMFASIVVGGLYLIWMLMRQDDDVEATR